MEHEELKPEYKNKKDCR